MKLETFAEKHRLTIHADFDPQRMHRWHVTIHSVYGYNTLRFKGVKFRGFRTPPVGVGQSFSAAQKSLVAQLRGGVLRYGSYLTSPHTGSATEVTVPKLKAA